MDSKFALERSKKHVPQPEKGGNAKRLNMMLRWLVRKSYPDIGIWDNISPQQLFCPLDVHVGRVARHLQLLERKQDDWKAVVELTENLKQLDPIDPSKYDIALFHYGVSKLI